MPVADMPVVSEVPVVEVSKAPSLTESIEQAMASVESKEGKTEPKVEEPKKEEPKKEEVETDDDKELTLQGKQLMLALRDPTKAGVVIKFLAEQAGYTKIETKAEAKEVKNEVLDALKESLGGEFDFLAEKLAPAIEKIVNSELKKNTADLREKFESQEVEKLSTKSTIAIESISNDFFGSKELPPEVTKEMSTLMDRYSPGKDQSIEGYVKDMFQLAVSNKGLTKVNKSSQEKINKNRQDAVSRLNSSDGVAEPSGKIVSPKTKMTLDQAVRAAAEAFEEK